MRAEMASERGNWQRFVLIKADKASGAAMRPRLGQGAMLLIDRHYNSLQSYRRHEPNLYVVKSGPNWQVRYVELQGSQLTLRPENQECALGIHTTGQGRDLCELRGGTGGAYFDGDLRILTLCAGRRGADLGHRAEIGHGKFAVKSGKVQKMIKWLIARRIEFVCQVRG